MDCAPLTLLALFCDAAAEIPEDGSLPAGALELDPLALLRAAGYPFQA